MTEEMTEADAKRLAAEHARRELPALGEREWRPTAFNGGWRLTAEGEDLKRRTGVPCLVVLDDGSVHIESSSVPPLTLIARYERTDPVEGDASTGSGEH